MKKVILLISAIFLVTGLAFGKPIEDRTNHEEPVVEKKVADYLHKQWPCGATRYKWNDPRSGCHWASILPLPDDKQRDKFPKPKPRPRPWPHPWPKTAA